MTAPMQPTRTLPTRLHPLIWWLIAVFVPLGFVVQWGFLQRDIKRLHPDSNASVVGSVLAVTIGAVLIVPFIVSVFRTGTRIRLAREHVGLPAATGRGTGLVLILLMLLHVLYYETKFNAAWEHGGGVFP